MIHLFAISLLTLLSLKFRIYLINTNQTEIDLVEITYYHR